MKLAPFGVLRGAAWPLDCLDGFGSTGLGDLSKSTARNGKCGSRFERAYQATIEQERAWLWNRTIRDSKFDKALALSSPSARTRIRSAEKRLGGPRNRAMRLAEYTLYRYLARAAGRSTPHGLWAGVTEVQFGNPGRVISEPGRCHFTPDLRPFQGLIRSLAVLPEYRIHASWRLNPTLHPAPQGGWIFLSRLTNGRIERRAMEQDPEVSLILAVLADTPPMALDRLAAEIARRGPWPACSRHRLLHMLEALAAGGVLIGGLDLPTKFETPWEALEHVAGQLGGRAGDAWATTIRKLGDHCEHLSAHVWSLSTDDFVARLDAARECIVSLCRTLDLSAEAVPAQVLRCDLHLPWRITIDEAQRENLLTALNDYEHQWLRGASPDAGIREVLRDRYTRRLAGDRPLGECTEVFAQKPWVFPSTWPDWQDVAEPGVRERLRDWETCLKTPAPEVVLTPVKEYNVRSAAPTGCLYAGLSEEFGMTIRSVADIPTLSSSRFNGVLDGQGLTDWIQARLTQSTRDSGISLAELRAPFELNPNVLASPALLPDFVDPWGVSPESLSLAGATLGVHTPTGRPVLRLAGSEQPWAVISTSTANLQSHDPVVQLLLLTGFHESPDRNHRATEVPIANELSHCRFTPRVLLKHGAVLRPRRSLLSRELRRLVETRGIERFRVWQGFSRELGWPEQLLASANGGEAIRIHRDSPLAVEALFKGIGQDTPYLAVQEASQEQGLSIPGQGNFVTELAIPFARQE